MVEGIQAMDLDMLVVLAANVSFRVCLLWIPTDSFEAEEACAGSANSDHHVSWKLLAWCHDIRAIAPKFKFEDSQADGVVGTPPTQARQVRAQALGCNNGA